MFAAHSAVAMLPETSFLRRYSGRDSTSPQSGSRMEAWKSVFNGDPRLQRLHQEYWNKAVDLADLDRVVAPHPGTETGRIYQELLSKDVAGAQAGRTGKSIRYTGDKDPRLIEFLPLIKELFPESHIVHIVRDPRDVLVSKGKAAWSRSRGWRVNLAIGRFQLELGERFGRELWGWRYHVVRYEDLLEAPERTLHRLTAELDLHFEPAMLEFGAAAEQLGGGSMEEWKTETLGPLLTQNSGKWRGELSVQQSRLAETVYGRWMRRYGYEYTRSIRLSQMAARFLYGVASLLYCWYRRAHLRERLKRINT